MSNNSSNSNTDNDNSEQQPSPSPSPSPTHDRLLSPLLSPISAANRSNRFAGSGAATPRSASQPPKPSLNIAIANANDDGSPAVAADTAVSDAAGSDAMMRQSPAMQIYGVPGSPWAAASLSPHHQQQQQQQGNRVSRSSSIGVSIPSRSASFGERAAAYTPTTTSTPTHPPLSSSSSSSYAFASAMRESRSFSSTFEDDESEALSDDLNDDSSHGSQQQQHFMNASFTIPRGRNYQADATRSRSQSLATMSRPAPIGSPLTTTANHDWAQHTTHAMNIPSSARYGAAAAASYSDSMEPGSRYGSLGALGRSPIHIPHHHLSNQHARMHEPSSPATLHVQTQNGFGSSSRRQHHPQEISNISPFVRDVAQIYVDSGAAGLGNGGGNAAYRDLWGSGLAAALGDQGGPGSGTTSRRHSVSIVQPRRGNVVGFDAPDDLHDTDAYFGGASARSSSSKATGGRGGLTIDDDDLAADLEALNFGSSTSSHHHHHHGGAYPPSQPSSLPNLYAPISSRAASVAEQFAAAQELELHGQRLSVSPATSRGRNGALHSPSVPSEGGSSPGGSRGAQQERMRPSDLKMDFSHLHLQQQQQQGRYGSAVGASYGESQSQSQMAMSPVYMRSAAGPNHSFLQNPVLSPISPSGLRSQHQQQQFMLHHRPSQPDFAHQHQHQHQHQAPPLTPGGSQLADLGRGVPLHALPSSWKLYIVEFKAGRTDLFHQLPPAPALAVGDLVIVEADRGHDVGKVVNDTITLAEVEAFQRQQLQMQMQQQGGDPGSPEGGAPGAGHGKKEILSKQILSKATESDARRFAEKEKDEAKALQFCQKKVRDKGLPMDVIDAEYQWDRRKLTFYFIAEKRIDFRELVRELFRTYKTRIWMASLQGPPGE